jgi:hypothetical protein
MRNEIFNRAVIIPLMEKGIKRDISMKRERQARRSSGKEKKEVELTSNQATLRRANP